jgi:hypothetical protein
VSDKTPYVTTKVAVLERLSGVAKPMSPEAAAAAAAATTQP